MNHPNGFDAPTQPVSAAKLPNVVEDQLIGSTPLLDLSAYSLNPNVRILAKCEYMSAGGSVKDRIGKRMILGFCLVTGMATRLYQFL